MMKEVEYDDVNNPAHYQGVAAMIQPVDITRELPGPLSNAVKYIWRAGRKGDKAKGIEDLEKALWYLDDWVENGYSVDMRTARAIWRLVPYTAFRDTRYITIDYILREKWDYAVGEIQKLKAFLETVIEAGGADA